MMRTRLREMPTAAELAVMYATPHDHTRWLDHQMRVDVTTDLVEYLLEPGQTVADLSCGDAAIARRLVARCGVTAILGDFAPGYDLCGPIEETIEQIPQVDLFICSETLEHVADPEKVLALIRAKTDLLVVSTPDGETDGKRNREHVHGWDSEEMGRMLAEAGFVPRVYNLLDLRLSGGEYAFQIWVAR